MSTTSLPPPDLKTILVNLELRLRDTMVFLYDVQAAALNAAHYVPLPCGSFTLLRLSLKSHWESIMAYLQKCHNFGGEVTFLDRFIQQEPSHDYVSLLQDLFVASEELLRESAVLLHGFETGYGHWHSLMPQLSSLLQQPALTEKMHSSAHIPPSYSAVFNLNPDGLAALAATTASLTEVRTHLDLLRQFWTCASAVCRALALSTTLITPEYSRHLGEKWTEYQEELISAKVSIAKSCDAVGVEPAARPPLRREQRRRGSSKSENSLATSSGLNGDKVPKFRWGFRLGKRDRARKK